MRLLTVKKKNNRFVHWLCFFILFFAQSATTFSYLDVQAQEQGTVHPSTNTDIDRESGEVQQIASLYNLDPQLVADMLTSGAPAAYINQKSAELFVAERKSSAQKPALPAQLSTQPPLAAPLYAAQRQAGPIQTVALVIDGSGSIDANDFALQKEGIQLALRDPLLVPRNSSIALLVVQYAETSTRLEVAYRLLDGNDAANQVIDQIGAIVQLQGETNPGDGITRAAGELQAHATSQDQTTICLSTDGLPNAGSDVATALANARSAAVPLDSFSVIAIEDPPFYAAADFHTFYDPLVFGDGAVSVVENSNSFASFVGATCFAPQPVEVVGLEAVQSIQDLQNSVQMIAGKTTYVRTHLQPVEGNNVTVAARLHGKRNGVEFAESPLVAENNASVVVAKPNALARRNQFEQSLNFRLPPAWLNGTIELTVERVGRPFLCKDVANVANDCSLTLTFIPVDLPQITFVGVSWTDPNTGSTYEPTDAALDELTARLKALYPIAKLDANKKRTVYNGTLPITTNSLAALNTSLATMRYMDCLPIPNCTRLYYGVLVNTLASGQAAGFVASGNMPNNPLGFGRNRHAHELGHLLGMNNSVDSSLGLVNVGGVNMKQGWCKERDATTIPDFPYFSPVNGQTFATLGPLTAGESAKIFGLDTAQLTVVDPAENYELMSYCGGGALNHFRWISKYTYDNLVGAINNRFTVNSQQTQVASSQGHFQGHSQGQAYRIFRGIIHFDTNQIDFLPALHIESVFPPPSTPAGDYTMVLKDKGGNFLGQLPFEPEYSFSDFPPGNEQTGIFVLAVPENQAMAQADVMNQDQLVDTITASNSAPTVQMIFPNGGENLTSAEVTLHWQGSDLDGNALSYAIQYSRDNGDTWQTLVTDWTQESYSVGLEELGETNQGLMRVLVSDGFNAASDTSDGTFTAPNHPPTVIISSPFDHAQYSGVQNILFEGTGQDVEDGQLDSASLTWSSSVDGFLGAGNPLSLDASTLSLGEHKITLTASDANGLSGSASLIIVIYRVPAPPPATLTMSADATSLIINSNSRATIQVLVKDVNGTAIPGYRVTFHTTHGTIDSTAVTDATGTATAQLVADTTPGIGTVTANAGGLSSNLEVNFVTGPPALLSLSATPTMLPADGVSTSTVVAIVKDAFGNLLADQPVSFATTLGTIPPLANSDVSGVATVQLVASTNAGDAVITASTASVSSDVTVAVGVPAVSGVVFADFNRNGQRDVNEPGIAGMHLRLMPQAGGTPYNVVTNADGSYIVLNLVGGDYQVTVLPTGGAILTTPRSFLFTATRSSAQVPDVGAIYVRYCPLISSQ